MALVWPRVDSVRRRSRACVARSTASLVGLGEVFALPRSRSKAEGGGSVEEPPQFPERGRASSSWGRRRSIRDALDCSPTDASSPNNRGRSFTSSLRREKVSFTIPPIPVKVDGATCSAPTPAEIVVGDPTPGRVVRRRATGATRPPSRPIRSGSSTKWTRWSRCSTRCSSATLGTRFCRASGRAVAAEAGGTVGSGARRSDSVERRQLIRDPGHHRQDARRSWASR